MYVLLDINNRQIDRTLCKTVFDIFVMGRVMSKSTEKYDSKILFVCKYEENINEGDIVAVFIDGDSYTRITDVSSEKE